MAIDIGQILTKPDVDSAVSSLQNKEVDLEGQLNALDANISSFLQSEYNSALQNAQEICKLLLGDDCPTITKDTNIDELLRKANENVNQYSDFLEQFNNPETLSSFKHYSTNVAAKLDKAIAKKNIEKIIDKLYELIPKALHDELLSLLEMGYMGNVFSQLMAEVMQQMHIYENKQVHIVSGRILEFDVSVNTKGLNRPSAIRKATDSKDALRLLIEDIAYKALKNQSYAKLIEFGEQVGVDLQPAITSGNPVKTEWTIRTDELWNKKGKLSLPEYLKKHPEDIELRTQINKELKDIFINFLPVQPPDENIRTLLRDTLNRMLLVDPNMFFMGDNTNAAIGFIGELQTGLYIRLISNGKIKPTWVGPQTHAEGIKKGQQFSADWLVENFGIQVKNAETGNVKINFGNMNFEDLIPNLRGAMVNIGMDWHNTADIVEFVADVQLLNQFNVMYYRRGVYAVQGNNEIFKPTRQAILQLVPAANRVLSLCSAVFLHAQTASNINGYDANTLYVINGAFHTAASVIAQIQNQVQSDTWGSGMSFKVEGTDTFKKKYNGNIVDLINNTQNVNWKEHIKLTSSFNFGSLS